MSDRKCGSCRGRAGTFEPDGRTLEQACRLPRRTRGIRATDRRDDRRRIGAGQLARRRAGQCSVAYLVRHQPDRLRAQPATRTRRRGTGGPQQCTQRRGRRLPAGRAWIPQVLHCVTDRRTRHRGDCFRTRRRSGGALGLCDRRHGDRSICDGASLADERSRTEVQTALAGRGRRRGVEPADRSPRRGSAKRPALERICQQGPPVRRRAAPYSQTRIGCGERRVPETRSRSASGCSSRTGRAP